MNESKITVNSLHEMRYTHTNTTQPHTKRNASTRKKSENICTIETKNTNNELHLFTVFRKLTQYFPLLLLFQFIFSPLLCFYSQTKHNEWYAFHLDFVEYCHFDYFNFRCFFCCYCHFIRISNLMNITLCHLYCKWIFFSRFFFIRVRVANGIFRSTDPPQICAYRLTVVFMLHIFC